MSPAVLQLRIDNQGTKPLKWRRIKVRDDMTVTALANYLAVQFNSKTPFKLDLGDINWMSRRTLRDYRLKPGQIVIWRSSTHSVVLLGKVEAILMYHPGEVYPMCLGKGQITTYSSVLAMEKNSEFLGLNWNNYVN